MGFDLDVTIPVMTVLLQGVLSFFSPCVLPIVPLYASYLSGGATQGEDGTLHYSQRVILRNTVFFIVGVSFAFFSLSLGFSALGTLFTENQMLFSRIGGVLIICLGLMQLGVFGTAFYGREFKLPIQLNALKMSPLTAFLMGFTFSFAWTPCVGPALSTVLIMIASTGPSSWGLVLMGVYTLGFTLPFLLVGLFTTKCLNFFKAHRNVVAYTTKIGAVILILMGLLMFTGTMNRFSSALANLGTENAQSAQSESSMGASDVLVDDADVGTNTDETASANGANTENAASSQTTESENAAEHNESEPEEENQEAQSDAIPAIDFELQDQYGNTHTLADYQGKTIFLNIWATWCPACCAEMPDIQALYEACGENQGDVIVLGVAFPTGENYYTQEGSTQDVIDFLAENGYTYPTLMDTDCALLYGYGIMSFPTTFMIDSEGNVYGYVSGMLSYDIMESIIAQTQESMQ
ncbi:MAG: cytochrome c biogenesis protein CcdA [Faecalibacterium sp.]